MSAPLTNEEKKAIAKARQSAVRHAWKEEQARVKNGFGTRDWNKSQQKEIIERGSVKGFDGHHMKSVSEFPEYAGESKNIQFLTEKEHFEGAHQGSYHNLTNGYYDPETKKMNNFKGRELKAVPVNELTNKYRFKEVKERGSINNKQLNASTKQSELYSEKLTRARNDYVGASSSKQNSDSPSIGHTKNVGKGIGR